MGCPLSCQMTCTFCSHHSACRHPQHELFATHTPPGKDTQARDAAVGHAAQSSASPAAAQGSRPTFPAAVPATREGTQQLQQHLQGWQSWVARQKQGEGHSGQPDGSGTLPADSRQTEQEGPSVHSPGESLTAATTEAEQVPGTLPGAAHRGKQGIIRWQHGQQGLLFHSASKAQQVINFSSLR